MLIKTTKKLILIITPRIKGGPWQWGADLTDEINRTEKEFCAEQIYSFRDKLLSPFRQDVKLIHTTNPLAWSVLLRPVILTIHGKINGLFWKTFYQFGRFRASIVTVPSEFLRKSLQLEKAVVIPNAIDMLKFTEVIPAERDFFNILTVTKFWFPAKARGLFELARIIFSLAKDFDKKINWRIVGFGPLLENVKKSVGALERPKNLGVQWFGFDLPQKYFSDSDIFAYFSHEDNMPIAVMEAMASGLSVVTNKVGAVGEIIDNEKNGFIASDSQDYQNILLKLMNNFNLRSEIGKMAREKIRDNFSWEVVLPKWIELYKRFL